jgi:hypothetical protein
MAVAFRRGRPARLARAKLTGKYRHRRRPRAIAFRMRHDAKSATICKLHKVVDFQR